MPDPTWDLVDNDCSAIDGGFSSTVGGSATVTAVVEEGRDCWKLSCTDSESDWARVVNSSVSWDSNVTIEWIIKMQSLSNSATAPIIMYFRDVNKYQGACYTGINTNEDYPRAWVARYDGSVNQYMTGHIDISDSTWHTFRIVVKDDYITIWIDRLLFYHGWGPTAAYSTLSASTTALQIYGSSQAFTMYIDHVRVSSIPKEPDSKCPLSIEGEDIVSHIIQGHVDGIPEESLRYRKTNCVFSSELTYGIPLVDTTDAQASKVRIYNGTLVKALMKLPTF